MTVTDDQIPAIKLRRITKGEQKIRDQFTCAALTGLLAHDGHSERGDQDYAVEIVCRRALKYGEYMVLQRSYYGG